MTVGISDFQASAAAAAANDQVTLTRRGSGVNTRSGRLAQWIGNFRVFANRRASHRFVESLRNTYGQDVSDRLVRSHGLNGSTRYGRPLRVRQVREVLNEARDLTSLVPISRQQVTPSGKRRLAGELAQQMNRSLERGFVNQFVLAGDPDCPRPMQQRVFAKLVRRFNDTMEHLHGQFPALREIPPPNLSQNSLSPEQPHVLAAYDADTSTLSFQNYNGISWTKERKRMADEGMRAPALPGFEGTAMHEYAHHLSSEAISDKPSWLGALAVVLKENGIIADTSMIDTTCSEQPSFATHIGEMTREMGLGFYAGTNADEFVAEALCWRMTPGYGSSIDLPRMPRYLEGWLHEHFPFTRDGPIPDPGVEFDPARVPGKEHSV